MNRFKRMHVGATALIALSMLFAFAILPDVSGASPNIQTSSASVLVLEPGVVSTFTVSPDSATGTNQNVTIYVEGTGCNVTRWWTSATVSSPIETFASFIENGVVISTSTPIYGLPGDDVVGVWGNAHGGQGTFPKNAKLCNTWFGINGKPCETIEC